MVFGPFDRIKKLGKKLQI